MYFTCKDRVSLRVCHLCHLPRRKYKSSVFIKIIVRATQTSHLCSYMTLVNCAQPEVLNEVGRSLVRYIVYYTQVHIWTPYWYSVSVSELFIHSHVTRAEYVRTMSKPKHRYALILLALFLVFAFTIAWNNRIILTPTTSCSSQCTLQDRGKCIYTEVLCRTEVSVYTQRCYAGPR